jgi:murein DD-endopeptidase MepM/ murein hydrolase activator NlpD
MPSFERRGRRPEAWIVTLLSILAGVGVVLGFIASRLSPSAPGQDTSRADAANAETVEPGPIPFDYTQCVIRRGDTLTGLAVKYNLRVDTLVSCNAIVDSRGIREGQSLRIPNQDGLLYTLRQGESLASIAGRYGIPEDLILQINRISALYPGRTIFLPGARMDAEELSRINGDLYGLPVRGSVSSPFGLRENPFTGEATYHHGVDFAVPYGSPVVASRAGTVAFSGHGDPVAGNYVIISHGGGVRTYYFHLSSIGVQCGQKLAQGQFLGRSGDSGEVTGAHLHFGISRNGVYFNPLSVLGGARK